jgi:O-antigen ligase
VTTLARRFDARAWPPIAWLAAGIAAALGLALALDPRAAGVLSAAIIAPLIIWSDPRLGVGLLALALGLNIDVATGLIHVSLPQLIALALVVGVLVRARGNVRAGVWAAAGFIFVLAMLPSVAQAVVPAQAVSGLLKFAVAACMLAVVVRILARHPSSATPTGWLLIAGACISLVPAFVQVAFGIGPEPFRAGGVMRAFSTFAQPNTYGVYLAGMLPFALGWALAERRRGALIAVFAIAAGIVLTGSRGAWAGSLIGLLAFYIAALRPRFSVMAAGVAGLAALVAVVLLAPREFVVGRLDLGDWSTQQRLLILLTAWDGITRSPLLGYGPGSFEGMLPSIARTGLYDDVTMPHNVLLHIWFEFGLLALICFIALIAAYVVVAFRAARRMRDLRIAGLLGGVIAMLGAAMLGTLFIRGVQETFILLIALTAALPGVRAAPLPRPGSTDAHPLSV